MEVVFIPKKVADRLKECIQVKGTKPDERILPITYLTPQGGTAMKADKPVRIKLKPHGLRGYAATFAFWAGTSLEIVSNPALRDDIPIFRHFRDT